MNLLHATQDTTPSRLPVSAKKLVQEFRLTGFQSIQHTVHIKHIRGRLIGQHNDIVVRLILVEGEGHETNTVDTAQGLQAIHVVTRRRVGNDDIAPVREEAVSNSLPESDHRLPRHSLNPSVGTRPPYAAIRAGGW